MSRIGRTFPRQTRLGAPVEHAAFGVTPPQQVLPLPTLGMQTLTLRAVAVSMRVAYPRRVGRVKLRLPLPPKLANDVVTGSAAPSGTVVEAALFADTQQQAAAPTGSVVEQGARGIEQPVVEVMLAGGHRRGHWILRAPQVVTPTETSNDTPSGSAASSGTASDALAHAGSVSGSAAATGTVGESYQPGQQVAFIVVQMGFGRRGVQSVIRPPARILTIGTQVSDVVSGSAAPSGTVARVEFHTVSLSGSAAPSGTLGESFGGPAGIRPIQVVSAALAAPRRYRRRSLAYVAAPATVTPQPLPLENQRRIGVTLVARGRAELRRRRGKVYQPVAKIIGAAVYSDVVTGTAPPATGSALDALTHTGTVTGSAAATGTIVEQRKPTDSPTGSASPTGTRTEAKIGSDLATGTAAATGSATDSYTVGNTATDNPSGTATPTGTRLEAKIGTNAPSGSAAATGSLVELKLYPDQLLGTATPAGSVGFETYTYGDHPVGAAAVTTGTITEAFTARQNVSGTATPSGSVVEKSVAGYGDVVVKFTVIDLTGRWAVALRV